MNLIWMILIYLDDMDMICRVCKLDKIQGRPRIAGSCKDHPSEEAGG